MADSLADLIKERTGKETMASDLTYDLRSGADFVDKLEAFTFATSPTMPFYIARPA